MTQQEMILHKKRFGQYFSGKTVADMLFSLLPEKHEWVNVVDPLAGIGDMLVAVRENAKKCSAMFGVEIDEEVSRECAEHVPEGGFGKRHIHTLPYKIIPAFDPDDDAQKEVIEATKALMEEWKVVCESGQYKNLLGPNSGTLPSRRRRQQSKIRELASYGRYAAACAGVLR